MNRQEKINKLIDAAMGSLDEVEAAAPKPYLFTRIHARMNKETASFWEMAGRLIAKPAVAFTGLCLVVLLNVWVVMNRTSNATNRAEQVTQNSPDELSYSAVTIYDLDNTQP